MHIRLIVCVCCVLCVGSFADELEGASGENKLCYMHIFQLYVQHTGTDDKDSSHAG